MNHQSHHIESRATVQTSFGAAYLKRLCRHFARKVPVTVTKSEGRIQFPFGACRIDTNDRFLFLRVEVDNSEDIDLAEKVVTEHLIRMANRDNPEVNWRRGNSTHEEIPE